MFFAAPFRSLGFCRSLVSCPCCSSVGFRLGLGFCISCGWVRCLLPVLLFAGLALSSCSRRVAPASAPCFVVIGEEERGEYFQHEAVSVSSAFSPSSVFFQFRCQFQQPEAGWFVSGLSSGQLYISGSFPVVQVGGVWGFWVSVSQLPVGFSRVQWLASGSHEQ